jgi:hypothetical protein
MRASAPNPTPTPMAISLLPRRNMGKIAVNISFFNNNK